MRFFEFYKKLSSIFDNFFLLLMKIIFVDCARDIHLSHVEIATKQTFIHLHVSVTQLFPKPKNLKSLHFPPEHFRVEEEEEEINEQDNFDIGTS